MDNGDPKSRLCQLSTHWSTVFLAHASVVSDAREAQEAIIERYGEAIYRYLRRLLKDEHVVEELCQDFALRLARGDFRNADPEKGRFRDLLKTAITRMVIDYRRRQDRRKTVPFESGEHADDLEQEWDKHFQEIWRQDLINRVWSELARHQEENGTLVCTILRLRVTHPEWTAQQIGEQLRSEHGRSLSPDAVRQSLHRSRELFAELLFQEVRQSLSEQTNDAVEAELADLGLLHYCQPALEREKGNAT